MQFRSNVSQTFIKPTRVSDLSCCSCSFPSVRRESQAFVRTRWLFLFLIQFTLMDDGVTPTTSFLITVFFTCRQQKERPKNMLDRSGGIRSTRRRVPQSCIHAAAFSAFPHQQAGKGRRNSLIQSLCECYSRSAPSLECSACCQREVTAKECTHNTAG